MLSNIQKMLRTSKKSITFASVINCFIRKTLLATLPFLAIACLSPACRQTEHNVQVHINTGEPFRNGDLVLRCGHGLESKAVTTRSRSAYSHIGMLHLDTLKQQWTVIHAVPGESKKGEPEYLKAEPLDSFFCPLKAAEGAWMRINCDDCTADNAAKYCLRKVNERVVFDNKYLLSDTARLYCTELVWRAYLQQGIDISGGNRHEVPTLFCEEGECIFPCDIEKCNKILFVKSFNTVQL